MYVAGAAAGVLLGRLVLEGIWRGLGAYRIRRAGPRRLKAATHRIWRDPGPPGELDAVNGPGGAGGAPVPPFRFIEEHTTGSQPCLSVRDAQGRRWRVKWGDEVRCETFAVRAAWACGFFAEVTYFVRSGTIAGCTNLSRTRDRIDDSGAFCDARFELDDPAVRKLFEEHSWAWNDNPFVGTRELTGLKIVVMLLSNWDTKDRRDVARGSNTAIFEHKVSRLRREARYLVTDWGGSMGRWGATPATRGRWDVAGFEEQTPHFVKGTTDGWVTFGYSGQRTDDVARNVSIADALWFHGYAARVPSAYWTHALLASGASQDEAGRFTAALLERLRQLDDLTRRHERPNQ